MEMGIGALSSALGMQRMMGDFLTDVLGASMQMTTAQAAETAKQNLQTTMNAQAASIEGLGGLIDVVG